MSNQENPSKGKNDSRTGIDAQNKPIISASNNSNVVNNQPNTNGNDTKNKIQNPYVKNNQITRTASALTKPSMLNKIANPFSDGDGGGDIVNNNNGGKVLLDKTGLDERIRFLLRHYLELANPIYEQEEVSYTVKKRDGTSREVRRTKPVFKGYQFMLVDGEPLEKWIKENIGQDYQLDPMTKEVFKINGNNTPQPQE